MLVCRQTGDTGVWVGLSSFPADRHRRWDVCVRLEAALDRLDLLICDELGFGRLDPDQSQLQFTLLAHRYTRGALIVTSNLEFADWTRVFAGDERLTAALLDRLTHRCHLLEFRGSSYRFHQSLAAREGRPDGPSPPPAPTDRRRLPALSYPRSTLLPGGPALRLHGGPVFA